MKREQLVGAGAALVLGSAFLGCSSSRAAPPSPVEERPATESLEWSPASGAAGDEKVFSEEAQEALSLGTAKFTALKDPNGNVVARVAFVARSEHSTRVEVFATLPAALAGYHGFHIHANDNPANGVGCIADPAQPANTHFVSADGHYNPGNSVHGAHAGDMPSLFIDKDGKGSMVFTLDRFGLAELTRRAVIIHLGADNFGNVPTGAAVNQYTPNGPDAVTLTQNTGNAGNRIACGVIP
ncbi:superoxide dismutase family protein [Pendulispora albinea]|uniref:Superoxide dismutase [Cu-Zn] n=1 Tax=Pendulispora albinea TaxID=2741071 RepID=A0ABZ2LV24_9BACT